MPVHKSRACNIATPMCIDAESQNLSVFRSEERMDTTMTAMNPDDVKRLIDEDKIEFVKIGAPDIEGVYRGKRVASSFFRNSLSDGFGHCDVLFVWDIAE